MRTPMRTVVLVLVVAMAVVAAMHHGGGGGVVRSVAPPPVVPGSVAAPAAERPSTPLTAPSSSTTTTAPPQQGLERTDALERQQPLVQALPHDTAHYKIDYRVGPGSTLSLQITLFAILNNPNQLAQYQADLRQYKSEALDYIRAHGQDPATFAITYLPPEAARL